MCTAVNRQPSVRGMQNQQERVLAHCLCCHVCPVGRQPIKLSLQFIDLSLSTSTFSSRLSRFNVRLGLARWVVFTGAATSGSTVVGLKERTAALGQNLKIGVV